MPDINNEQLVATGPTGGSDVVLDPSSIEALSSETDDGDIKLPTLLQPFSPLVDFVAGVQASIHAKLVGGFFSVVLIILGMFILAILVVHQMSVQVGNLNQSQERLDLALHMQANMLEYSRVLAQNLVSESPQFQTRLNELNADFLQNISLMQRINPNSEQLMTIIEREYRTFVTGEDHTKAIFKEASGSNQLALQAHLSEDHLVSSPLERSLDDLVNTSRSQMMQARESFRSGQSVLEIMILATSFISLAVAMVVGLVLSWSFIRPVSRINAAMARISDGDFTQRVEVKNRDEFGTLGQNLNVMTGELSDLYEKLQVELAERKRLNEIMEHHSNQLKAANTELEAFSYSVSHDLRAPLRSLNGFSQALIEDYSTELGSEGADYLNRISTASQRMGELIDDLLGLSRITRTEMNREPVELSNIVNHIIDNFKIVDSDRPATFTVANGVTAIGDPHLLKGVMENLLGNAWKYTSKVSHAKIEFGVQEIEGETVYFVRDNGAGFNMEYSDKLFNPFQRLHSAEEFEGTGIGLATVRRIIGRHGGRVWPESEVGQGATFYFTLGR